MKLTKYPIGIVVASIMICLIGLMLVVSQVFLQSNQNESFVKNPTIPTSLDDIAADFYARALKGDVSAISDYADWIKTRGRAFEVTSSTYFLVVPHLLIDNSRSYSVGYGVTALIGISENSMRVIDENINPIGLFGNQLLVKKGWSPVHSNSQDKGLFSATLSGTIEPVITYTDCDTDADCDDAVVLHPPLTDHIAKLEIPEVFRSRLFDSDLVLNELEYASGKITFDNRRLFNDGPGATSTLTLRPGTPHFDQETEKIFSCRSRWESLVDGLSNADIVQLAVLESCITTLQYPFKKFPIPGTNSYFGFMGNEYTESVEEHGAMCQMGGSTNGCLLYKVENGKPVQIIVNNDLRDIEPLKANADSTLLVHRFPYEICSFSRYENDDFVSGTTTATIVAYVEAGSCDDRTTLTFFPKGRATELQIDRSINERVGSQSWDLIYKGKSIGIMTERQFDITDRGFPSEPDLGAYALQSDKTKFYFSVASSTYILDLAPSIPKLIKR